MKLSGAVYVQESSTFEGDLYLTVRVEDVRRFHWNAGLVDAYYQGQRLAVAANEGYPYVQHDGALGMKLCFRGSYDPAHLWAGADKQPVPQEMRVVLDSAMVYEGAPVLLDTIRAVITPPPSGAL